MLGSLGIRVDKRLVMNMASTIAKCEKIYVDKLNNLGYHLTPP